MEHLAACELWKHRDAVRSSPKTDLWTVTCSYLRQVVCRHPVSASSAESTTVNNASTRGQTYYETLDDLLVAVSPVFAQRRQRLLFAKLEEVAKTRSWDVVEEEPSQEERGKKTEED